MAIIPFPTSSRPGSQPALGQGRLVNSHAVKEGEKVHWRRVAGMTEFADPLSTTGLYDVPRGLFWSGVDLIWTFKDRVARVNSSGDVKLLNGEISGRLPVTIARNNNATPDIVVVAASGVVTVGDSTISGYPDGNVGAPNSVSMLDGYLLFTYGDGTIKASDLNTTTISPSSVWKAESNPDGLSRGMVSGQLFYAFGSATIEVLSDVGTSPFPLARQAVIPVGLIGQWAVAGGAVEGWDTDLFFVAQDGTVRRLSGYQTSVVSIPDVTRDIRAVADKTSLIASVYVMGENAFWSLSCAEWTWEYNVTTGEWHQRESYRQPRWRAAFSAYAFGKWLTGDVQSGRLFELTDFVLTEDEQPLIMTIESDAVKAFPARVQCRRADFDVNVGYGREIGLDPIEVDPQVMVSWSDDGGVSWSTPLIRSIGREGRYSQLVSVLNTGLAYPQGRKWRVQVSDPVPVTLVGGTMEASARIF
jgi:hypothetical protein